MFAEVDAELLARVAAVPARLWESRGRMMSIMDKRLRRAPDAEWVLMYRLGLSRKRIAALVRAEPATVGYHLAIARRQDPGLEADHQAAAGTEPAPPSCQGPCPHGRGHRLDLGRRPAPR